MRNEARVGDGTLLPDAKEVKQKIRVGKTPTRKSSVCRPPLARMQRIHESLVIGAQVTASRMAGEFEVSPRTVQRDIDFMRDQFNLPIEYEPTAHTFLYREPVAGVLFGGMNLQAAQSTEDRIKSTLGVQAAEPWERNLSVICERYGLKADHVLRALLSETLADALCDSRAMDTIVQTARSVAAAVNGKEDY